MAGPVSVSVALFCSRCFARVCVGCYKYFVTNSHKGLSCLISNRE